MIGHEACLLVRETQGMQQLADVKHIVQYLELTQDQVLNQGAVPATGRVACLLRPRLNQCTQPFLLCLGQFGWTPWREAIAQTVEAFRDEAVQPVIDGLCDHAQHFSNVWNTHPFCQQQQGTNAPDQSQVSLAECVLPTRAQRLDGFAAKLYSHSHGMPLDWLKSRN